MVSFCWGILNLDSLTGKNRRPTPELPLYIYPNVTFSIPIAIVAMCLVDLFGFAILPFEYSAIVLFAQVLIIWALIREASKLSHYPLEHERRSGGEPIMEITELGIRARTFHYTRYSWNRVLRPEEMLEWNRINGFKLVLYNLSRYFFWTIEINLVDGSKTYVEVPQTRRGELLNWLNSYLARFGKPSSVQTIKNYIAGSE